MIVENAFFKLSELMTSSFDHADILETKIRRIRDDALKKKDRLLLGKSPLAPWGFIEILSFRRWQGVINYWAQIHRDLEELIRHKSYLTSFKPIVEAFNGFAENGVGFYNLKSPFRQVGNGDLPKQELAQYPTLAPNPITIEENNVKIGDYEPKACSYEKYSKRLINFLETVKHTADDTFDLMKSISSTPGLQVALLAAMISLVALIVGLASVAVSTLVAVLGGG
jgi:hypothetical protein